MTDSQKEALAQYTFILKKVQIYQDGFTHLQAMGTTLVQDFHYAANIVVKEEEENIKTRAALRTLFSYLEAHIFAMKRIALNCAEFDGGFSAEEIAMLKEETCELDDKGYVRTHPKFIPLPRNLKFAFEMCARALTIKNPLNVGMAGWDSFQKALNMRNRITHPRTLDDLHISDEGI